MKELLDKLSSYNLFNYLLPGILFALISPLITSFSFVQKDIVLGVFLYYFIGLVISRIGSLVVEPILRRTRFLRFADYNEFVIISQKDPKIDLFSEVNNMYRTLCSLFFCLLLLKLYEFIHNSIKMLAHWEIIYLPVVFLLLFLFSYKKQTAYINKRIEAQRIKE